MIDQDALKEEVSEMLNRFPPTAFSLEQIEIVVEAYVRGYNKGWAGAVKAAGSL